MSTKVKDKKKLTFDFSDDSDEDCFAEPSKNVKPKVVQDLKYSIENGSKPKGMCFNLDESVVASDASRRKSELPSFFDDYELPVTESTRLSIDVQSYNLNQEKDKENVFQKPKSNPKKKQSRTESKPLKRDKNVQEEIPTMFDLPVSESTRLSIDVPKMKGRTDDNDLRKDKSKIRNKQSSKESKPLIKDKSLLRELPSMCERPMLESTRLSMDIPPKQMNPSNLMFKDRVLLQDVKNRYSDLVSLLPGNSFCHTHDFDLTNDNSIYNISPMNTSSDKKTKASLEWDSLPERTINQSKFGNNSKKTLFGKKSSKALKSADQKLNKKHRLSIMNPLHHGASTLMNIKLEEEDENSNETEVECSEKAKVHDAKNEESFVEVQDMSVQVNFSDDCKILRDKSPENSFVEVQDVSIQAKLSDSSQISSTKTKKKTSSYDFSSDDSDEDTSKNSVEKINLELVKKNVISDRECSTSFESDKSLYKTAPEAPLWRMFKAICSDDSDDNFKQAGNDSSCADLFVPCSDSDDNDSIYVKKKIRSEACVVDSCSDGNSDEDSYSKPQRRISSPCTDGNSVKKTEQFMIDDSVIEESFSCERSLQGPNAFKDIVGESDSSNDQSSNARHMKCLSNENKAINESVNEESLPRISSRDLNTSKNCLAECNTTEDLSCHNTVDNVSESAEQSALIKEVEKSSEKSGDSVDRLNSSSTSQESESGCQDPDYTPKDRLGRTCNAVKNSPSVSSRKHKADNSSDEEDAFDTFLEKIKSQCVIKENSSPERQLEDDEDFIISDASVFSSCDSDDDEDEEMLHVKVDRKIDEERKLRNTKSISYNFSDSDDDSDLDVWTRKTPKKIPKKGSTSKTPNKFNECELISSDDDEDDFKQPKTTFRTPFKPIFKTPAKPRMKKELPDCPMTAPRMSSKSDFGENEDLSFLASLSADYPDYKRHPEALRFIRQFKNSTVKNDLTSRLFTIFNQNIFENKLPTDMAIEWNSRYIKTAGTFSYRGRENNFTAKITLSVKVCDQTERVRDTLAHEMCHAAVKLINGVKESHGPVWKSWAKKINKMYPFMPVISRCHDYTIHTKYTYKCKQCNYRIGRHSKSLDTDRKVCGHCKGEFEVFLTKDLLSKSEGSCSTPRTPRTPNKFALFVKECYSQVKKRQTGLSHKEVMNVLSKEFAEKNKLC